MEKLFNRHTSWDFHKKLSEEYGPVVKLREMFGVRRSAVSWSLFSSLIVRRNEHYTSMTPLPCTALWSRINTYTNALPFRSREPIARTVRREPHVLTPSRAVLQCQ